MRKRIYNVYIFITLFLLTLSHCEALVGTSTEKLLEYAGYFLLLPGIILSYYRAGKKCRLKNNSKIIVILFALMVPGIIMSELGISRKITVIFTMAAIIIVSSMSDHYLYNAGNIRTMAYACLTGVVVSTIITVVSGVSLFKRASEPTFGMIYCFNGGIRDKNVATMMIAIIMSLYLYSKGKRKFRVPDVVVILISVIVIIAANSRGAWIELAVFIFMLNYKKIERIARAQRSIIIIILLVFAVPVIVYIYNNIILSSATFLIRRRGLLNYISMFGNDTKIFLFGNPDLAYGTDLDYATAVRSVTGWNGTIENSWLNILIKSGVLGVLAYMIIFARAIYTAFKSKNMLYRTIYLSVTVTLFISSFVAIYIQTIHGLFGIYCYLIMGYYSGLIRREQQSVKFKLPSEFRIEIKKIKALQR